MSLVTLSRHMDVHVCIEDIVSLQSAMQIFIGRIYMGKDMDKQDKTRTPCTSLIKPGRGVYTPRYYSLCRVVEFILHIIIPCTGS